MLIMQTTVQECSHTVGGVRSFTPGTSLNPVESSSHSAVEPVSHSSCFFLKNMGITGLVCL